MKHFFVVLESISQMNIVVNFLFPSSRSALLPKKVCVS